MQFLFFEVLNRTISASWLILLILILRPLFRNAPKWINCLLWSLVAIRLLSPIHIESILSLIPSRQTIPPDIVYTNTPTIHSGITFINSTINPVISSSFAPSPAASINPLQIVSFIASWVWCIGAIVMITYALISWIILRRKVSASFYLGNKCYLCDSIPSPFILGIFSPKIYLPSAVNETDISQVLLHERAHIQRKDHWWKPLGFMLLSLTWYHPLMWIAYILLCRDIEAACDEKVVKDMSLSGKKVYSTALVNCSVSKRTLSACPLAFGEVSVKSRVKNVLNFKKPTIWIVAIAILLLLAVAVCFLTNPKEQNFSQLSSPFDNTYSGGEVIYMVSEVMYDAPQYSFTYTPQSAPIYRFTQDMKLEISENKEAGTWLTPGTMEAFELSDENFLKPCTPLDMEAPDLLTQILKSNSNSWKLDVAASNNGTFYYLLQQRDGSLLLCLGYHHSEHDHIRWIFRLQETVFSGEATSPDNSISKEELLENAISEAIINQGRKEHSSENYACESHIVLDQQTLLACGRDVESTYEETTVYLMALYQEYNFSDGTIVNVGGSHMPVAITFEYTDYTYNLLEYWTPQDGSYYLTSIQEKFPENTWSLATDTQMHILRQIQSCYEQAVQYAGLDTIQILNDLYNQIEQSPTPSSSPGAYIDAHPIAYREITYYGMYALRHAFGEFMKGGQTGLRGHLMALACQDILMSMGEPFEAESYMTGQEWFDQFETYAYTAAPQIESPYSSQYRPVIRLLLDME